MTIDKTIEEMNRAICHFMNIQGTDMFLSLNYKYHEDWNQLMNCWKKIYTDFISTIHTEYIIDNYTMPMRFAMLDANIKQAHEILYKAVLLYTTTKQKD